jgi:hypothetical protein
MAVVNYWEWAIGDEDFRNSAESIGEEFANFMIFYYKMSNG